MNDIFDNGFSHGIADFDNGVCVRAGAADFNIYFDFSTRVIRSQVGGDVEVVNARIEGVQVYWEIWATRNNDRAPVPAPVILPKLDKTGGKKKSQRN